MYHFLFGSNDDGNDDDKIPLLEKKNFTKATMLYVWDYMSIA